ERAVLRPARGRGRHGGGVLLRAGERRLRAEDDAEAAAGLAAAGLPRPRGEARDGRGAGVDRLGGGHPEERVRPLGAESAPPDARRARARAQARERDQDARGAHPRPAGRAGRAAGGGRGMSAFNSTPYPLRPLADVADLIMGQAPKGDSYNTDGEGVALIAGASDLGETHPTPSRFTTAPTKIGQEGDIILCVRATIG